MKPHNFIFPALTSAGLVVVFWRFPQWAVLLSSPWIGSGGRSASLLLGWRGWLAPRGLSTVRVALALESN